MDDNRMNALAAEVVKAAAAISRDLGGGDEVRPNSRARKPFPELCPIPCAGRAHH